MKYTLFVFTVVVLASCQPLAEKVGFVKRDTVLVYFTDSLPKKSTYSGVYNNFTETRDVRFTITKNYDDRTYSVDWALWIDGDIAESSHWNGERVKPEDLEKYKAKIRRIENDKIPQLLKVWEGK